MKKSNKGRRVDEKRGGGAECTKWMVGTRRRKSLVTEGKCKCSRRRTRRGRGGKQRERERERGRNEREIDKDRGR